MGDIYFIESQLVFGCKSSPIFHNEEAKMLIMILRLDAGMDCRLSVQQLDYNPVAGRKGSLELRRY